MELNDEPEQTAAGTEPEAAGDVGEEAESAGAGAGDEEPGGDEAESATAASEDYSAPYGGDYGSDDSGQSLLRRLSPYLTVAGILLIIRIVVYSLRRRRR